MSKRLLSTLLLVLGGLGTAHAVPMTMHFTVAGFAPVLTITPAPTDPVTGTIVWDADPATSAINSLLSIDLTLAGHVYSLGEVGFDAISNRVIGGTVNGVNAVAGSTNDFAIVWNTVTMVPIMFDYASAGSEGFWISTQFAVFSITAGGGGAGDPGGGGPGAGGPGAGGGAGNAVPVPGTLALLAGGVLGFAARRRRG